MNTNEFSIVVGSDVDYEDLIAEISYRDTFVALISQENGLDSAEIQVHPRPDGEPWSFKLQEFMDAIAQAKSRLWELRKQP